MLFPVELLCSHGFWKAGGIPYSGLFIIYSGFLSPDSGAETYDQGAWSLGTEASMLTNSRYMYRHLDE